MGIGLKEDVMIGIIIGVFITVIINTVIFMFLFRLKQRNDNYLNGKRNVGKYDDDDKYSGGYDMG